MKKPPQGFFNILLTFQSIEKELNEIRHELILGNYYLDLSLFITG